MSLVLSLDGDVIMAYGQTNPDDLPNVKSMTENDREKIIDALADGDLVIYGYELYQPSPSSMFGSLMSHELEELKQVLDKSTANEFKQKVDDELALRGTGRIVKALLFPKEYIKQFKGFLEAILAM